MECRGLGPELSSGDLNRLHDETQGVLLAEDEKRGIKVFSDSIQRNEDGTVIFRGSLKAGKGTQGYSKGNDFVRGVWNLFDNAENLVETEGDVIWEDLVYCNSCDEFYDRERIHEDPDTDSKCPMCNPRCPECSSQTEIPLAPKILCFEKKVELDGSVGSKDTIPDPISDRL